MHELETYESHYYEVEHRNWFEHPNVGLFSRIARFIPDNAAVLDVGCGRGDFLRYLLQHRQSAKLCGIDYTENGQVDGIHFLQGDILKVDLQKQFDAVVSLAVIEHLPDVPAFLQRVHHLLNPGGLFIVMTLNDESLLYLMSRLGNRLAVPLAFNRIYSSHHLHHFTRKSFRTAVRRAGFEIESHFAHATPLQAIDLPVSNRFLDAVLRCGVWTLFRLGDLTGRNYLQTIIARAV